MRPVAANGFEALVSSLLDERRDVLISQAECAVHARRRRNAAFFDYNVFREPAWDILLDLYVAHYRRREISISSACIAAGVPATTALRHIGRLIDLGLLARADDQEDRRKAYLHLTPRSLAAMDLALLPAT